jgi:hypothetical protein
MEIRESVSYYKAETYRCPSTGQCSSFVHISDLAVGTGMATGHRFDGRSLIPGRGKRFFSSSQRPERF